jgi:DNA-binding HxlR family transcriptional regulator
MSTLAGFDLGSVAHVARFFHFRWGPPVLHALVAARGAKLVTLANRIEADRKSVRRALDSLIEMGLARRNSGHGHPMRPEYLPTHAGKQIAAAWMRLELALRRCGAEELGKTKWPVPVLILVAGGAARFGEMVDACDGLTPRALAIALRTLTRQSLVARSLHDGFPPWVLYQLRSASAELQLELANLIGAFERLRA